MLRVGESTCPLSTTASLSAAHTAECCACAFSSSDETLRVRLAMGPVGTLRPASSERKQARKSADSATIGVI